jgi:hypothetical protein
MLVGDDVIAEAREIAMGVEPTAVPLPPDTAVDGGTDASGASGVKADPPLATPERVAGPDADDDGEPGFEQPPEPAPAPEPEPEPEGEATPDFDVQAANKPALEAEADKRKLTVEPNENGNVTAELLREAIAADTERRAAAAENAQ